MLISDGTIPTDRVPLLNIAKKASRACMIFSPRSGSSCSATIKTASTWPRIAASSRRFAGLKGAMQQLARIYILPPRPCKYWRDVEFRVYFKRFIWPESKRSEKQFRSLRCLFSNGGAPTSEKQGRARVVVVSSSSSSTSISSVPSLRCFFFFFEKVASNPEQQSTFRSFFFSRSGNRCTTDTVAVPSPPSSPSPPPPPRVSSSSHSSPSSSSSLSSSSAVCSLHFHLFFSPPWVHGGCVLNVNGGDSSRVCLSEWLRLGSLGRR